MEFRFYGTSRIWHVFTYLFDAFHLRTVFYLYTYVTFLIWNLFLIYLNSWRIFIYSIYIIGIQLWQHQIRYPLLTLIMEWKGRRLINWINIMNHSLSKLISSLHLLFLEIIIHHLVILLINIIKLSFRIRNSILRWFWLLPFRSDIFLYKCSGWLSMFRNGHWINWFK